MIGNDAPFKISASTNVQEGFSYAICLMCENIDEKVGIELNVIQTPCKETNNCPKNPWFRIIKKII